MPTIAVEEKQALLTYATLDSIIGKITLVKQEGQLSGLYQVNQKNTPQENALGVKVEKSEFIDVISQLDDYFDGTRKNFELDLDLRGSELEKKVWTALQSIPYGQQATYADVAKEAGYDNAVRAVASAVGRNPITIIVPCHRVRSQHGKIKYSARPYNKVKLLEIEAKNALL